MSNWKEILEIFKKYPLTPMSSSDIFQQLPKDGTSPNVVRNHIKGLNDRRYVRIAPLSMLQKAKMKDLKTYPNVRYYVYDPEDQVGDIDE